MLTVLLAACVSSSRHGGLRDEYARLEPASDALSLDAGDDLFSGDETLSLPALVEAVLERNPSVEVARQAWRGAIAQYPQAVTLQDPMVTYSIAPLSIGSDDVRFGQSVQLSQPLPWPGKRRLRGEVVLAEAEARAEDLRVLRQRLALMAAQLYYDYAFLDRAIAITEEHIQVLTEYGDTVIAYLEARRAWQEDALKIDVDVAELRKRRTALEADRDVVVAQLNALLHRRTELALPHPPELEAPAPAELDRSALQEQALARRPELSAAEHRIHGAEASVDLADREFRPDFRLIGTYSSMWAMVEHQFMVGISFNLPVMRSQRRGAVDEARARVSRALSVQAETANAVRLDVETAYRNVTESDEIVALYRDEVLPASRGRIEAVRRGLDAGRTTFLEVLRAELDLWSAELRLTEAVADAHRTRAKLAWAVGAVPGIPADGGGR